MGPETIRTVSVFCASSDAIHPDYFVAARELGTLLGEKGWRMLFGGGTRGLMGEAARAVHSRGGCVTGIIPSRLNLNGITYESCDELIVTQDLRERKGIMDARSDAFFALAGGFGTLEEIAEHLTLKQLKFHPKPVVLINTRGFFDPLVRFFDHLIAEGFARPEHQSLYHLAATPADAVRHVEDYAAPELPEKYA